MHKDCINIARLLVDDTEVKMESSESHVVEVIVKLAEPTVVSADEGMERL